MFQLSAEHYDALYATKDYEREAHLLRDRLSRIDPSLHTVLDVACGTGAHDEHLCRFYEVDGLDLRTEFTADLKQLEGLAVAKRGRQPGFTPNPRLERLDLA